MFSHFYTLVTPKENKRGRTLRLPLHDHNISVSAAYSLHFTPRWLADCNQKLHCSAHGDQSWQADVCRRQLSGPRSLLGPGCCCSEALEPGSGTTASKYAPSKTLLPRQPSRVYVCGVHPSDEYKVAGLCVASLLPFTASP